jgi:uncharacterized membrane protein
MVKIKHASVIYKCGVYVSLILIGISLIISIFTKNNFSSYTVNFDINNFIHSLVMLDPVMMLYLASLILVASPFAAILYLFIYYTVTKEYGNSFISLVLLLILTCVIIFKVA